MSSQNCNEIQTFTKRFTAEQGMQDLINNPSKFFHLTLSVFLVSVQQFSFREVKITKTHRRFWSKQNFNTRHL